MSDRDEENSKNKYDGATGGVVNMMVMVEHVFCVVFKRFLASGVNAWGLRWNEFLWM